MKSFLKCTLGRGFTLIEIIIAMTILSLIALIIGSAFGIGIRAWDKGEADIENLQRIRFLSERLSQQIKSCYPHFIEKDGKKTPAFSGASDSLWFVTTSETGLKWVSYSLKDERIMYNEGIVPDKKILEKVSSEGEALDLNILRLKFEYFSIEDAEWKDTWDSEKEIPAAVRITTDVSQIIATIPLGMKEKPDGKK